MSIRNVISESIDEIKNDHCLRTYGAILSFTHLLSCYFWVSDRSLLGVLTNSASAICWPIFSSCYLYRLPNAGSAMALISVYVALGAMATCAFLAGTSWSKRAYWLFSILTVFKFLIFLQDYRLRMNQHYMLLFVSLVFLFTPGKRVATKWLIVLFYFWAGTLKLNQEWLGGGGIYRIEHLWIPKALHSLSFHYVVFLELVLSFGLVLLTRSLFWLIFLQFVAFHLISWSVVGYFYPLVMFSLLSIFPLSLFFGVEESSQRSGPTKPALFFLFCFSGLQFIPYLYPGDVALTGEGRYFALNMFDAKSMCNSRLTLHKRDGKVEVLEPKLDPERRMRSIQPDAEALPVRLHCDPLIYFSWAQSACRRTDIEEVDLFLEAKRSSATEYKTLINIRNFCALKPTYSMFSHNEWIAAY